MADSISSFLKDNMGVIGAGAAGLAVGATAGSLVTYAATRKSSSKRKKSSSKASRKRSTVHRKKRGRRTPRTAGKGRDRSTKRIRYTKKGQPYVIMKSGKAKFIKKSSAKRSHRTPGGRY